MRRQRQEGAATANYLRGASSRRDGAQVLAETDGSNATVARYTLAPFGYGDLVAQRRSSATHWYHFDALGSTRALTDSGATVTDTALFQAFGTQVASSGSTVNPHSWVGKLGYATEARLSGYLLRRRYYQDGVGRFLSRDPMGGLAGDYTYVGQRPTRGVDPSGLVPRKPPGLPGVVGHYGYPEVYYTVGYLFGRVDRGVGACIDRCGRRYTYSYARTCHGWGTAPVNLSGQFVCFRVTKPGVALAPSDDRRTGAGVDCPPKSGRVDLSEIPLAGFPGLGTTWIDLPSGDTDVCVGIGGWPFALSGMTCDVTYDVHEY
jgi:RHS repeat-associated protein